MSSGPPVAVVVSVDTSEVLIRMMSGSVLEELDRELLDLLEEELLEELEDD